MPFRFLPASGQMSFAQPPYNESASKVCRVFPPGFKIRHISSTASKGCSLCSITSVHTTQSKASSEIDSFCRQMSPMYVQPDSGSMSGVSTAAPFSKNRSGVIGLRPDVQTPYECTGCQVFICHSPKEVLHVLADNGQMLDVDGRGNDFGHD